MLRKIIAIILLFAIGLLFYGWSYIKKDTNSNLNKFIDEIEYSTKHGNIDESITKSKELKTFFISREIFFSLFTDQEFVSTLNTHIDELQYYINNQDMILIDTKLLQIRNYISDFYEDNSFKLGSII